MNNERTTFIRNEKCFIRKNHDCGRYFGVSKTCFIACPDSRDIKLVLDVIAGKLEKEKIDPFIAVRERAYGEDIFCTKICGKIIESLFCMVLLDDVKDKEGIISPNPNVYYEYGMMTSMNKEIIPLQKVDGKLAFNIQSLEAIKYNEENLADEVEKAIVKIMNAIEKKHLVDESKSEYNLYIRHVDRILELIGLDVAHKYIEEDWVNACKGTIFRPHMNLEDSLFFIGIIEKGVKISDFLGDTIILINRLDRIAMNYDSNIEILKKEIKEKEDAGEVIPDESEEDLITSSWLSFGSRKRSLKSLKSKIQNYKWNQQALNKISIIFITFEEIDRFLKLIDNVDKIESKMVKPKVEIWDANKIEELSKDLGLIIEE